MGKRAASDDDTAIESPPLQVKSNIDIVKELNALQSQVFRDEYIPKDRLEVSAVAAKGHYDDSLRIKFITARDMRDQDFQDCLQLIEKTSRQDYEDSTIGWRPKRKLREMKDADMRYLLVSPRQTALAGFLSFMVTHDSSPSIPVLYIYEIHLEEAFRGLGLGKHLLSLVEHIAYLTKLNKVMLTCFCSNEKAYQFYEANGYAIDVVSPEERKTRNKIIKADYVIMSRAVNRDS